MYEEQEQEMNEKLGAFVKYYEFEAL